MIGPRAINSSPRANRQNHSLFLHGAGGGAGEAGPGAHCQTGKKERESPPRLGVCPWGTEVNTAQSRILESPMPFSGVLPFKESASLSSHQKAK